MSLKRTFKYLALTTLGLVMLYVSGRLGMNYMGYCFKEQRFLTDQEKIDVVINRILSSYPPTLKGYTKNDDGQNVIRWHEPEDPIPYKSKEEFLEVNKDCCKVVDYIKWDAGHPGDKAPFFSRLSGKISSYVHGRYQVRYKDPEGRIQTRDIEGYSAISNCGRIVRPY